MKNNIVELLGLEFLHLGAISPIMYKAIENRVYGDQWGPALTNDEVAALKAAKGLKLIGKGPGVAVYRINGELHAVKIFERRLYPMCAIS